ncbi:MAG: methylated-DNA--[protein]-cysteine S-methyltransferase [Syntrophaceae bacterium]|nr:methylated-DNA--[protein]-cysteine S-methyltransferase [Syntrophaceae bacterium]
MAATFYEHPVRTRLCTAALIWSEDRRGPRVVRIFFPAVPGMIGAAFPGAERKSAGAVTKLGDELAAFAEGQPVSFDTALLDMGRVTPFQRKVLAVLAAIPRGKVMSYGGVAAKTGSPGGARAAGRCCAKNPFPVVYPCHRVIRADGSLGGFLGGLELKRALLEMEGIRFGKDGKVLPGQILG